MTVVAVEDLVVEPQIDAVGNIAPHHDWCFERVGPRCFRVSLSARNGDIYQVEVDCARFPVEPAAFHWRNRETGALDQIADSPEPYGYFHSSGRICAPWNRLASMPDGPHPDWVRSGWQEQSGNKGHGADGGNGATHSSRTAE